MSRARRRARRRAPRAGRAGSPACRRSRGARRRRSPARRPRRASRLQRTRPSARSRRRRRSRRRARAASRRGRPARDQSPRSVNSATASSREARSSYPAPSYGVRRWIEVEQPVRARLLLVRHADAARVDDPDARDGPLELGVRVAADDRRHVEPVEEEGDPLLGRALGEDVEVVARRGVAVEHVRR